MKERFAQFLNNSPKSHLLVIAGLAIVILALPFAVTLSQHQQNLTQNASGPNSAQALKRTKLSASSLGLQSGGQSSTATGVDTQLSPDQLKNLIAQAKAKNPSNTYGAGLSVGLTGFNNTNPSQVKQTVKQFLVQFLDQNNNLIDSKTLNFTYDPSTQKFVANTNVNIPYQNVGGAVKVALQTPGYLKNTTANATPVIAGSSNNISVPDMLPGDIVGNGDSTPSVLDYNALISCSIFSKDGGSGCKGGSGQNLKTAADLNGDGVVNQDDYTIWLKSFKALASASGTGKAPSTPSSNNQDSNSSIANGNPVTDAVSGTTVDPSTGNQQGDPNKFGTTYDQNQFAQGVPFGGLQGMDYNAAAGAYTFVGPSSCSFTPSPIGPFQTRLDASLADENNTCDLQYIANNYTRGDLTAAKTLIHSVHREDAITAGSPNLATPNADGTYTYHISSDVQSKYPEITNTTFSLPYGSYNSVGNIDQGALGNTKNVSGDPVLMNKPASVPNNATYGYLPAANGNPGGLVWWDSKGNQWDANGNPISSAGGSSTTTTNTTTSTQHSAQTGTQQGVTQGISTPKPTPAPTPAPVTKNAQATPAANCSGHAYYAMNGSTCCDFTYRTVNGSCQAACHAGVSASLCQ